MRKVEYGDAIWFNCVGIDRNGGLDRSRKGDS